MILCSCNRIDSEMIRVAAQSINKPNEKLILKKINWKPDCAICKDVLVKEIKLAIERINNAVHPLEGENNGC